MRSSPSRTDRLTRIVSVAVPVPGLGLLRYRIPDGLAVPPKGARVAVPLGRRVVVGCVVDPDADAPEKGTLRDVDHVIDDEPFLPSDIVDLALWVGEYYASGPGDAMAVAMPPAARRGQASSFRTVRVVELVEAVADQTALRGPKQRLAIDAIAAHVLHAAPHAGAMPVALLAARGVSSDTIRSLVKAGLIRVREEVAMRDPAVPSGIAAGGADPVDRVLTTEQAAALDHLTRAADARSFKTTLVQGVTGSGKTEVYLRLARHMLAQGRSALVLVPEIALTPAAAAGFRARFGSRVAIQHSGLSTGERHDQWHRIRRGDVDVVVGTRSAVFAPLDRLGLIVVDEEHDGSYKQDESPRYHARDVAVIRGRAASALVVLGSATPSIESASNARAGRYDLVTLRSRVLNRPLADVRIVDMRGEYADCGPDVILSRALVESIDARLARREQTLILLNRRGFATTIFCRECGATLDCPHCSVTLTFHRAARRVRCHYCNYAAMVSETCAACGGAFLEQSGYGTERIEAEIRERFPEARVARVDRDTIRRRGAIERVLADVGAGRLDIVVGTQMIAKGHDFPAVTLVGVVSADVGLGLADFRAAERTFQLVTQVVGRAGRGETPGEAIVQSIHPDHYSIRAAAAQNYAEFFDREMRFRTEMHYPPVTGLINVIIRHRTLERALEDAHDLARGVRRLNPAARVLGPAPAALARLKDEHRAQILIKSRERTAMRRALLEALAARPDLARRAIVDVDPLTVL